MSASSPGEWKSEIKAGAVLVSPEASLLGVWTAALSHGAPSWRASLVSLLFFKDTGHTGAGTYPTGLV